MSNPFDKIKDYGCNRDADSSFHAYWGHMNCGANDINDCLKTCQQANFNYNGVNLKNPVCQKVPTYGNLTGHPDNNPPAVTADWKVHDPKCLNDRIDPNLPTVKADSVFENILGGHCSGKNNSERIFFGPVREDLCANGDSKCLLDKCSGANYIYNGITLGKPICAQSNNKVYGNWILYNDPVCNPHSTVPRLINPPYHSPAQNIIPKNNNWFWILIGIIIIVVLIFLSLYLLKKH